MRLLPGNWTERKLQAATHDDNVQWQAKTVRFLCAHPSKGIFLHMRKNYGRYSRLLGMQLWPSLLNRQIFIDKSRHAVQNQANAHA